jgi:choline dehydrogenase-like flavoprotein
VLGGGTAGCVLAGRLSENRDLSVCLVEAGPDYGPYEAGGWPEDILDARALGLSHSWETDRDDRSQLHARILGGCSAHNACIVLEGAPADYDEWGPGWTYAELEPYLRRAERGLRTRPFERDELSPWHRAFAEAGGEDTIVHPVNIAGEVRWNAAFAYVDPARGRPNLTITADTLVDRILLAGERAVGAATSAGNLEATSVVVTAGAYGSPAILLRSGIGPEQGLPVGEGLSDHVGVGFGYEPVSGLVDATEEFAQSHLVTMGEVTLRASSSLCPEGVCDLFLFPAVDFGEEGWEFSAAVFAMKPESRGRVRLNSADPRAPLTIEHGFLSEDRDATVLAEGVDTMRRTAAHDSVQALGREVRPGPDADVDAYVREAVRGFFHPTGTCAIGRVVDPEGRVLGFENLYVADASIMPTIPRANTNLTTAAIAERIAELLS